jgi:dienelactone hydrolase
MIAGALAFAAASFAIVTEDVTYEIGEYAFEGYAAYPSEGEDRMPMGILIVHDWDGLGEYEKMRAEQLAEVGFTVFAVDIYGQGVRPENPQESREESGKYYQDLDLYVERMEAGLEQLRGLYEGDALPEFEEVAMGYCFGGSGVLQLARSGADIDGVVSFHGGLSTSQPAGSGTDMPKILAINGARDPVVPNEDIVGFIEEMNEAGADFQLVVLDVDGHSFTVPQSDDYDAEADTRATRQLFIFLDETMGAGL